MQHEKPDHLDTMSGIGFGLGRGADPRKAVSNLNRIVQAVKAPYRTDTVGPEHPLSVCPAEIQTPGWNSFWPTVIFKNVGANDIPYLGVCIPDRTNHSTGLDTGRFALRTPNVDCPVLTYLNVKEDDVAATEIGVAIPMVSGPYFVELDAAVSVGDPVGALDGDDTLIKGAAGFRVMAYHSINGNHYASIYRDEFVLARATADPAGGQVTVQTCDEDGGLSGVDMDVNTATLP